MQITPWMQPKTQLEFFNLRSGQTHDFEHLLTGGGFNFMGELVPYWYRLTNTFKFIKNPELAGELCVNYIFGSLRYTVRTVLHYPQVWPTAVNAIQRGMRVGQESDALFMAKPPPPPPRDRVSSADGRGPRRPWRTWRRRRRHRARGCDFCRPSGRLSGKTCGL